MELRNGFKQDTDEVIKKMTFSICMEYGATKEQLERNYKENAQYESKQNTIG